MVPRVAAVLLLLCAATGCSRTDDSAGDQSSVSSARDDYITEVVERLTAGPSEIDIEVEVVDSDRIHAVSYPPNKIAVTNALFDSLMTEAELACVLSHEISHHRLGHVEDRLAAGETPNVSSAVDALAAAGWTSGEEYAADAAAVELCHAAGYDPLALGHVFHRLKLFVAAQSPGDPGLVDHIDERIETLLDTIARQDLTGGANGFMSYYNLRSQAESDGQGEAQAPAGRQFLPEIPNAWGGVVVDVPV